MKKFLLFCFCLLTLGLSSYAQQNPTHWIATYKATSANEGEIVIMVTLEKGWHTYSQRPTDAGPINTSISFVNQGNYQLVGKTEEFGMVEEYEKAFEAKVFSFSGKGEFRQKVKLIGKPGFIIPFKVEFVCCNDNMCLPPKTVDLSVKTQ